MQNYPRFATGTPKSVGHLCSACLNCECPVSVSQSWVPLLELLPQRAVEGPRLGLQHEVGAAFRPPHLLTLAESFADNRVDGTFHKSGGDSLTVAATLGIIRVLARLV